jgi:hypothetical protein
MVLLCPHLIDSIGGSLPSDAWEWESSVISTPIAQTKRQVPYHKDDKVLAETIAAHLTSTVTDKRGHIIAELYSTEINYVRNLDIIINVFTRVSYP